MKAAAPSVYRRTERKRSRSRWTTLTLRALVVLVSQGLVELIGVPPSRGEALLVILNSTNRYTDTLEAGATISQSGGSGPLVGTHVEFSCGKCNVATFDDAVPQLGGGYSICGYGSQVFTLLLKNDDKMCARSKVSGKKHEIDLLSRVGSTGCEDGDDGASCAAAGNRTSYLREEYVEQLRTGTPTPTPTDTTVNTATTTATATSTSTPTGTPVDTATATPTETSLLTPTSSPTNLPSPTVTASPQVPSCVGDCDGKGQVTIDELVRMVSIALGTSPVSECTAGDGNGNGLLSIDELVLAVNHALSGCRE
jgi:hypothetical protein